MRNRRLLIQLDDQSVDKLESYFQDHYSHSRGNTIHNLCEVLRLHATDVPGNYNIDATITFDFSRIPEKKVEINETDLKKACRAAGIGDHKFRYIKEVLGLND